MGLLSKALTVSTGGTSKLVAAGVRAGVAHQAAKATETTVGDEASVGDEPTVSRWTKINDRFEATAALKADAKAAAKDVRVWTFTSRPGNVAKELQKEIVKQARDGFTLTSQNVSAGHSKMRTLQVITAIFTRTV
jgi:hypothetical protein